MAERPPAGLSGPSRAAVLGHPISHSLSPVLHRAAYAELGLDWVYEAADATETDLPVWVDRLRGDPAWRGLSLTMPLKRDVIPLLDAVSPLARAVGAVNTVTVHETASRGVGLRGDNTDVEGIVKALQAVGTGRPRSAVVLGAGATAASAVAALRDLGAHGVVLLARAAARAADALAAAHRLGVGLDVRPLAPLPGGLEPDVVVSTLPAGAADAFDRADLERLVGPNRPVLLDVVYQPWPTALAGRWAEAGGGAVVGGLEMLLHQAVGQVRLMTGRAPSVEVMRAAAARELKIRAEAVEVPL